MAIALGTSATDLRVGSSSISRMAKGGTAFWDADAADYVSRVQAADGEPLELGVVAAYHAFCLGCKDVGIWDAIQACCVMAGARTIAGALVPLKGDAPTAYPQPVNFVSGDYSRSLGLQGDGSTKYLDANRAANADGDTDHHIAAYMTQGTAVAGEYLIGAMTTATSYTIAGYAMYSRAASAAGLADGGTGLYGVSRDGDASKFDYVKESGAVEQPARSAVAAVIGNSHSVFGYTRNDGVAIGLTPSRLSYYSIGSALDLAALDTKVTALMAQIAAALA